MRYRVTKTYQYTETVMVDAETEARACEIANHIEGERNEDDHLYDATAKIIEE